MVNKDILEKTILLGIIRDKNWEVLLRNQITRDMFSYSNYTLYDYIKSYTDDGRFPDLSVVTNMFDITSDEARECLNVLDLDGACKALHTEYLIDQTKYRVGKLNDIQSELYTNPVGYIQKMKQTVDGLEKIGYQTKAVDIMESMEETLQIDKSNVISTGFKEIDNILVGLRKGEELLVVAGRTGQGKSWLGMKFAESAAEQGYRVGIYSGEMSKQQLQERLICCAKPEYTSTQMETMEYLKSKHIFIKVLTQKELRRRATVQDIEEMVVTENLDMVVIDQLSLMEDNTSKPRNIIKTAICKYKYGFIYIINKI